MWLVREATSDDLADALRRDLDTDHIDFDDLGWRGLWAYITAAPPGTALYHAKSQGWTLGDKLGAELLYEVRQLLWRYTAIHFEGGKDFDYPNPIAYPGSSSQQPQSERTWASASLDDLVSPEVKALLRGA